MRHYTRKTNRATTPKEVVIMAVKGVVEDGNSYNAMSATYKIPKRSLVRYCKQYKNMKATTDGNTSMQIKDISVGYEKCKRNRIFTSNDEDNLVQYIAKYNDINSGLSYKQARRLTYQYAIATKIKVPPSWKRNMIAGEDWFCNFMKRHRTLNIGASEASLTRTTNFNHTTVGFFFDNLADIMTRFKLQPYNIWNMDETGVFIVKGANKVVGRHDVKQIECLTSTERKQLVTLVCTVSAYGNSIPPFFVFPTVCFEENFIHNGPVGCAGAASPSGWMDEKNFLLYLTHFVKHVRPSQNNHVLFLLNNHSCYFSISALDFAKENGIIILSIPSNCSHQIHPFDIGVSSSLKILTTTAMDSWTLNHPDKTVSIYDIPGIVRNILPMVLTPLNIMAGFENTGIYPLKQKAFMDADFVSADATDRAVSPQHENKIVIADGQNITEQPAVNIITFNNHDNDNNVRAEDAYCTNDISVMPNATDNNNIITDDWKIDWNIIEITPDIQQISQNMNDITPEPQPSTSCEPVPFPVVEAKRQTQSITARARKGRTSTSLTNESVRDGVKKRKRKG
ncbi:uncharacterized protein LOC116847013 isoform X2 [Odontomachus brunneus]|uniref:uncharacterized protein LOC116847013 isoform X2 n=1 Tax=Odontomachus brunneus TaxID=486640 RepID=UPI0013F1E53B|nr:uncharacterized protein LOC116847013 isoform X2 [Odontomachus brunneus]